MSISTLDAVEEVVCLKTAQTDGAIFLEKHQSKRTPGDGCYFPRFISINVHPIQTH